MIWDKEYNAHNAAERAAIEASREATNIDMALAVYKSTYKEVFDLVWITLTEKEEED